MAMAVRAMGMLLLMLLSLDRVQAPLPARSLPEVIAADVPPNLRAFGRFEGFVVTLHVHTDGSRVSAVEPKAGEARPAVFGSWLVDSAIANVRTWRFAPHEPTEFDTEFRSVLRTIAQPCLDPDLNAYIKADLPASVEVTAPMGTICDLAEIEDSEIHTVSTVAGTVRCDCPDRHVVPGAHVTLRGSDWSERSVRSGPDGSFRFHSVIAGRYKVQVIDKGYLVHTYNIRVIPDAPTPKRLDLLVDPATWVTEALKTIKPVRNVVVKSLPFYPAGARAQGIEGVVTVRIDPQGRVVSPSGPPELATSAKAYVESWLYEPWDSKPAPPLEVTFTYTLLPADCLGGGPVITLRLPFNVDIAAKRIAGCGWP